MRHVLLGLSAFALAALGFYVVILNARHLTVSVEVFGGALIALALYLAFRTDMEAAGAYAVSLWQKWKSQ